MDQAVDAGHRPSLGLNHVRSVHIDHHSNIIYLLDIPETKPPRKGGRLSYFDSHEMRFEKSWRLNMGFMIGTKRMTGQTEDYRPAGL